MQRCKEELHVHKDSCEIGVQPFILTLHAVIVGAFAQDGPESSTPLQHETPRLNHDVSKSPCRQGAPKIMMVLGSFGGKWPSWFRAKVVIVIGGKMGARLP